MDRKLFALNFAIREKSNEVEHMRFAYAGSVVCPNPEKPEPSHCSMEFIVFRQRNRTSMTYGVVVHRPPRWDTIFAENHYNHSVTHAVNFK